MSDSQQNDDSRQNGSKRGRISRRVFLHRSSAMLGGAALAATFAGCGGSEPEGLSCTSGVAPEQQTMRTNMQYVEHGSDPSKLCKDCNFFPNPPPTDQCGNCTLNLGSVNPMGTCVSWAARQG